MNTRPVNPVGVKIFAEKTGQAEAHPPAPMTEKKRIAACTKSADRVKIDEEAIGKRWDQIKAEEREKRRSSGAGVGDVILMYEISTRRKSATQSLSAIDAHQEPARPLSRTMSDSIVNEGKTV